MKRSRLSLLVLILSWNEYVQRHILDPLGMENTATEHLHRLRGHALATGYSAKRRDGTRVEIPAYQVRGIPTVYIIDADSYDHAAKLCEGHPNFQFGSIEIREIDPMTGP